MIFKREDKKSFSRDKKEMYPLFKDSSSSVTLDFKVSFTIFRMNEKVTKKIRATAASALLTASLNIIKQRKRKIKKIIMLEKP